MGCWISYGIITGLILCRALLCSLILNIQRARSLTWLTSLRLGTTVLEEGPMLQDKKAEEKLCKATTDSCKITTEVLNGLLGQVIKDRLFNQTQSNICQAEKQTGESSGTKDLIPQPKPAVEAQS